MLLLADNLFNLRVVYEDYVDYFEWFFENHEYTYCLGWLIPTKSLMYKKISPLLDEKNKRKYNPLFCSYLTGLIEGDGTIIVPKVERSPKGKLYYPSIELVFDERDIPLATILQKELGFGSISKTKGVNAYRYTINNFDGLITMVDIINGYFRTPKIVMFNRLIDFLNQKFPSLLISKKDIDTSKLDSNAWLSGFLDADGYFGVVIHNKHPSCLFELVQSSVNHLKLSKKDLMISLSEFLNVNVREATRAKYPGYIEYIVRTSKLENNKKIISYLERNNLFSSKYLNYKDYKKVCDMINQHKHKTIKGINEIILIKNGMNSKRTEFNWDHLLNFHKLYESN